MKQKNVAKLDRATHDAAMVAKKAGKGHKKPFPKGTSVKNTVYRNYSGTVWEHLHAKNGVVSGYVVEVGFHHLATWPAHMTSSA